MFFLDYLIKNFNIINLCSKFVEGMNVDSGIKDKMNKKMLFGHNFIFIFYVEIYAQNLAVITNGSFTNL